MYKIIAKGVTGKSHVIDVVIEKPELYTWLIQFHALDRPDVLFQNYSKCVQVLHNYRTVDLMNCEKIFGENKNISLNVILKSFTMASNYNHETMTVFDPVSLEEIQNPYHLDPGCGHSIDENDLSRLNSCPFCRFPIMVVHYVNRLDCA